MTEVVIVSRTKMKGGVCIGGLTRDTRRNVRLLPAPNTHSHPESAPYQVGDVWNMELDAGTLLVPPHVEDVVVKDKSRIGTQSGLGRWIETVVEPWAGPVASIFEGHLRLTASRKAYVSEESLPPCSVGFWRPASDLTLDPFDVDRYDTSWLPGRISIKYVGVAPAVAVIASGTLIRVSLSRWFRPNPSSPNGCWLQISGCY